MSSSLPPFAVVPMEVATDRRLTLEQTRVLIALFSFRNKATNTVWPSRAEIAARCGLHPSNISSATTALVNFGWLKKDGQGGYSKSTRYTLDVPEILAEKVAESATVADQATVAESATQTVADQATRVVAESATRKEHTKEHTKEQKKTTRASAHASPVAPSISKPDGVTEQTWSDFLQLRKRVKAEVTLTALDGIAREAAKAGYSLEDALTTCCANGWRGFRADWVQPKGPRLDGGAAIGHTPRGPRPAPVSFAQQDREEAMCRWERMTGRVHPDRQQQHQPPHGGEIIDITPRQEALFIGGRQ